MLIGINEKNQIKQINNITDTTLTIINIDDDLFYGWSNERILCYCYKQSDNGISIFPYVDFDKMQEFESELLNLQAQVIDLEFEKITGGLL